MIASPDCWKLTTTTGTTVYNYGYDVAGNLVDYDGVTRTYNAANQMTNDGANTLVYDNNGNLRTVGSDTYVWDRANHLLGVGNHSYVYDGLGNRVQQTVSSGVTDYLNDVQPGLTKLLKQTTGTNVEQFVHAPRGIHAVDDGTDWNVYAQDGLGSVRAVVDDSAVVQSSASFDPYGNPMGAYGEGFGFTGEQTDVSGSVFLRARYYEPALGVFSALDPMETPNRYAYVSGNPINRIDPTGLFDEDTCTIEYNDYLEKIAVNIGVYLPTDGKYISEIQYPSDRQRREAWEEIAKLNPHIENPSRIFPGDRLYQLPDNAIGLTCPSQKRPSQTCEIDPRREIEQPSSPVGSDCPGNLLAVTGNPPNMRSERIKSMGLLIGTEQALPIWFKALGVSAGAAIMFVFPGNMDTFSEGGCQVYVSGEVGASLGAEGQGNMVGFAMSTASADGWSGVSANISSDISLQIAGLSIGVGRDFANCNYTSFFAPTVLGGFPSISTTVSNIVNVTNPISCAYAASRLGVRFEGIAELVHTTSQLLHDSSGITSIDFWTDIWNYLT